MNDWFIDANDTEKEHFYEWLIDNEAEEIVNLLPIFSFENQWISYKGSLDSNSYLITTNKIAPIKGILSKLDYQCSDNLLEEHPLKDFFNYGGEEWLFENIVKKEITSLLAEEKLELIKALREFNGVGKESIAKMVIFCNIEGEAKPLNQMIPYREEYTDWLTPYMISEKENFSELREYLVKEEDEFSEIIWNILEEIEVPISVLYNEYKWTDSRYTRELIDRNEYSEDDLLPIIEEADKSTQQYYLNNISKIELSEESYTKESSTYKILQLALKNYNDISDFAKKIFFKDKCIREFSIKDEVICTYKENNSNKTLVLSLAKLLPQYKDQSGVINTIKSLFQDKTILDKFLEAKSKSLEGIYTELKVEEYLTAEQYIFQFYYESCVLNKSCNTSDFFEPNDLASDFMDILCKNNIDIEKTPFTSHLSVYFNQKYFDNDYIFVEEQLSPSIEKWANTLERRNYLKNNGVREKDDESIQFRKSFTENRIFNIDKLTNQDLLNSIDYLCKRNDLQKPFVGDNQISIVKTLLNKNLKEIKVEINWDLFYKQSEEWNSEKYIEWRKNHIPIIRFHDDKIPFHIFYKGNLFLTIIDTIEDNYVYDNKNKCLYINKNSKLDNILFLVAKEAKTSFDMDDYQILCREGKVMISQEEAEKLKHYDELEAEVKILRERLNIQKVTQQTSEEYTTNKALYKGNLSKEEQIDAHKEAVLKSKKALEKAGYDCSKWILNEENDSPGFWQSYSQVCGCIMNPQGKDIDIVVKSAKGGKIHLSATDLDLLVADKHNILMVWDGTTAHGITNEELFGQNSNINLIFDTKNTPYEYYSALSGFFKYIKGTTFVIENPKHNVYDTIKSFGLDVKQEGKQNSLTEEDL